MTDETPKTEGEQKEQTPMPMTAKEATELRDALMGMNTGLKELMKKADDRAEAERRAAENAAPPPDDDEPDDELDDEKLEELPRRKFLDFMLTRVAKHMDTSLAEVKAAVQQIGNQTARNSLEQEANAFASTHEDFADFEQEMIQIAKESPGLSVARIYKLAKVENPDKAKAVEKKYADAKKAREEGEGKGKETPPPPPRRAGRASNGLSPSGTGGSEPNRRMSEQDAAMKAWDEAVAAFGNPFGTQQ